MRTSFIFMALLLVFGCAAQQTTGHQTTAADAANPDSGNTAETRQAGQPIAQPYVNTSGLSFERDVSDVINTDTIFPEPAATVDFSNTTTADGGLIVYYFHSSGCSACKTLRPEMDRLEAKYDQVLWLEYDLTDGNGSSAYRDFAAQYNLSKQQMLVPQVLVNGTVITDRFNINTSLEGIIRAYGIMGAG